MEKKVMIVDDELYFRKILTAKLPVNWEVRSFPNGEEALIAAKNTAFDLVLTDYNMGAGRMNGIEFAHVLGELRDPRPRIVLMSGGNVPEVEIGGVIAVFLQKPFTQSEFRRAVLEG